MAFDTRLFRRKASGPSKYLLFDYNCPGKLNGLIRALVPPEGRWGSGSWQALEGHTARGAEKERERDHAAVALISESPPEGSLGGERRVHTGRRRRVKVERGERVCGRALPVGRLALQPTLWLTHQTAQLRQRENAHLPQASPVPWFIQRVHTEVTTEP